MCDWKVNRHEWQTSCGEISHADWTNEGWKFCPFCGQPIEDATEYEPDTWGPDADAHYIMEGK